MSSIRERAAVALVAVAPVVVAPVAVALALMPGRVRADAVARDTAFFDLPLPAGDRDVGRRLEVYDDVAALVGDDRLVLFEARGAEWIPIATQSVPDVHDVAFEGTELVTATSSGFVVWDVDGDSLSARPEVSPWTSPSALSRVALDAGALAVTDGVGATWVYRRDLDGEYVLEQEIPAPARALALDRDALALVGDRTEARIYTHAAATWTEQATLGGTASPVNGRPEVALAGDWALVMIDEDPHRFAFFRQGGAAWSMVREVTFPASGLRWVGDVGLAPPLAAVGPIDAGEGGVAVYRLASDGVFEEATFAPGGGRDLGRTIGLFGQRLVAGRTRPDTHRSGGTVITADVGGAWAARVAFEPGTPCSQDGACLGRSCVDGVCCDSVCGGGRLDDCRACSVAAGATEDGVCAVVAEGAHRCRPAAGGCDVAEACDGVAPTCPPDEVAEAGVECRPASNACDAPERCDGFAKACPADEHVANGAMCVVADECGAWCVDGACEPMPGACDDGDVCTADTCEADGCAHAPVAGCCRRDADCDDGDPCTVDSCQASSGTCESRRSPSCVGADGGVGGDDAGGCAVRSAGVSRVGGPWFGAALALLAWVLARRRRPG